MLLFVAVFLTSCLEDADNDVTYSSDAAIISFSVTNFNTYHKTLSSEGKDSIYKVKEDGAKYKFYIDQTKNEIYNPDSLPVGTDAEHIICAINTARGGNLYIKSITDGNLSELYPTDSLDFTSERTIKVISLNGKYSRNYSVKVNVHKQLADEFIWNKKGTNDVFACSEDMKLLVSGKNLTAFVKLDGKTEVHTSTVEAPAVWTKTTEFDAEAYNNAIVNNGRYFIKSGNRIYSSADATTWTDDAEASQVERLIGACNGLFYAISAEGIVKSSDLSTWTVDAIADSNTLLPMSDISFVTSPVKTNSDVKRITLVGNRTETSDKYASVWNRLVEEKESSEKHSWNYVEQTYDEKYRLPRLNGLKVIAYADGLYAIGGEAVNSTVKPFEQIYFSKDGGITWLEDNRFMFPFTFTCNNSFGMAVDEVHNIWLICGHSGQIWRGRLNGLAWENKKSK